MMKHGPDVPLMPFGGGTFTAPTYSASPNQINNLNQNAM